MKYLARTLRRNQTDAERSLWRRLRGRSFEGMKFRRQETIGGYIVDFACLDRKLIVELDGSQHAEQCEYDEKRTRFLATLGYRVLRYWNNDVLQNLDGVLADIEMALRPPHPDPLPVGEGTQSEAALSHSHTLPEGKRTCFDAVLLPFRMESEEVDSNRHFIHSNPTKGESTPHRPGSPLPPGEGQGKGVLATLHSLLLQNLNTRDYSTVWHAMQQFTQQRTATTPDELWLVEHPPVFTQGLNGKPEHLIDPGDIPVIQTDRGGQVTYHGPGQLVIYTLIDLQRRHLGVRDLVDALESSVIAVLAEFGIPSVARRDAPGVYVDGAKIASLGLRVRRGKSYHGVSINVAMDLEPFSRINPCGYPGIAVTDLTTLGHSVTLGDVGDRFVRHFAARLGYNDIRFADRGPIDVGDSDFQSRPGSGTDAGRD